VIRRFLRDLLRGLSHVLVYVLLTIIGGAIVALGGMWLLEVLP
jgi:hypothetical protein